MGGVVVAPHFPATHHQFPKKQKKKDLGGLATLQTTQSPPVTQLKSPKQRLKPSRIG